LLISAFAAYLIIPLLMIGGAYLCFEGFEKLAHRWLHSDQEDNQHHQALVAAISDQTVDMVQFEKDKVKGAIRTDFVLSAEIIVITLGTVASANLTQKFAVLSLIAVVMTIGVYGLVAGIVKIDDLGLYLSRRATAWHQSIGRGLLWFAPFLMRTLTVVGTAAMFLVGGGIIAHGLPALHHLLEPVLAILPKDAAMWPMFQFLGSALFDALVGIIAGALVLAVVTVFQKIRARV
jgi:uncharacterized protein